MENIDLGMWGEDVQSEVIDYDGKVWMSGEFLNGDILKVEVVAEEFETPVLGFSFNLNYPRSLEFLRYEPGSFLEEGGDPFYLVKNDEVEGSVVFGETLRRNDSFPVGGGEVADFYFQIVEEEEFVLDFERGVVSILDSVRQDLVNVQWQGMRIGREDEAEVLFVEAADLQVNSVNDGFEWSNVGGWVLGIALIVILAIGFVALLKRKHQAVASVNFK